MISVGIDVSKGKSMACFLDSDGEILYKPFLFEHTFSGIQRLTDRIQEQEKNGPVKIIMEATGIYHLPVAIHLHEQGFDVSVVNPLSTSRYRNIDVRNVKTDKADSVSIANYGRSYWHTLPAFKMHTDEYFWLNDAADDYLTISKSQNRLDLLFKNKLERSMPGIDKELASLNKETGKNKLLDFVMQYPHFAAITAMSEAEFIEDFCIWARKKGYRASKSKATTIYSLALNGIPSTPDSQYNRDSIQMYADLLREAETALIGILARMREIAKTLPEYELVGEMGGVGNIVQVMLIAKIGDVRQFPKKGALVAYAGLDSPPNQSGVNPGTGMPITKRGKSKLRKILYQLVMTLLSHEEPADNVVYNFVKRKVAEGKPKKVAIIAGMAKFLRQYYGRVMNLYRQSGLL